MRILRQSKCRFLFKSAKSAPQYYDIGDESAIRKTAALIQKAADTKKRESDLKPTALNKLTEWAAKGERPGVDDAMQLLTIPPHGPSHPVLPSIRTPSRSASSPPSFPLDLGDDENSSLSTKQEPMQPYRANSFSPSVPTCSILRSTTRRARSLIPSAIEANQFQLFSDVEMTGDKDTAMKC